jgi:NTE family protein
METSRSASGGPGTAFVLSGGGNLGSIQAGQLEALVQAGIRPDILVGTSIGAANAAFLAAGPGPERAAELSHLWRRTRSADVFPINPLRAGRALLRGTPLFSREPLRRLLEEVLPYRRIEQAAVPLRIVATSFDDGSEVVFESGPVIDAVLASTALPAVFGPHTIGGRRFLDGGLSDQVPLGPAIEAGAHDVYVLAVGFPCPPATGRMSARAELFHSLGLLLSQRTRLDLEHLPGHHPGLRILRLPTICTHLGLLDLAHSTELIDLARSRTARFLQMGECPDCGDDSAVSTPLVGAA